VANICRFYAAFVLLLLSCSAPAFGETGKIKTLVVMQVGSIRGKHLLYIAKDAIRMDGVLTGRSTIAKGPKWAVQIYDKNTNEYSETPYINYHGNEMKSIFLFYGVDLQAFDWRPKNKELVVGIKSTHLIPIPHKNASEKEIRLASRCSGLWVDDNQFPKQIGRIVSKIYSLPTDDHMPLKFIFNSEDQQQHGLLTITNQTKFVPESFFSVPAGAKKVEKLTIPHPEGLL
jgi:hypothetical protein